MRRLTAEERALNRVTNRYLLRLAVQEACAAPSFRGRTASLHDLTPEVVEALGSVWLNDGRRVQADGFFGKVKKLLSKLTSAPQVWEAIKGFLKVTKLTDLPGAIHKLVTGAQHLLSKFIHLLFRFFPLNLFTLPKMKLFSFNTALNKLLAHLKVRMPKVFHEMAGHIGAFVKNGLVSFDEWTKDNLPTLRPVFLKVLKTVFDNPVSRAMIYIYIWLRVAEFEWDVHSIVLGFTGQMSMEELVQSLPGSGVGYFIGNFASGMFDLFPAAMIARLVWLVGSHLVSVEGGDIKVHWDKLSLYTGLHIQELQGAAA